MSEEQTFEDFMNRRAKSLSVKSPISRPQSGVKGSSRVPLTPQQAQFQMERDDAIKRGQSLTAEEKDLLRQAEAGRIATDPQERFVFGEGRGIGEGGGAFDIIDDSPGDDPLAYTELQSDTAMGIADTRKMEDRALDEMLAQAEDAASKAKAERDTAEANFTQSMRARARAKRGSNPGELPTVSGFLGFGGDRDPETIEIANMYNRRFADRQMKRQASQDAEKRLILLRRAKEKGMSVAELKQRLFDNLDRVDAEKRQLESDFQKEQQAYEQYGGLFESQPRRGRSGASGFSMETENTLANKIFRLNREAQDTRDMLAVLPDTEDFVFEVEPLPQEQNRRVVAEQPMMKSQVAERPMMESQAADNYLGNMLLGAQSKVSSNESSDGSFPPGFNRVDPNLVDGIKEAMQENPPTAVVDSADSDTGSRR